MCEKFGFLFSLFGNFLVNFSFESQRCLAVLSVFEIQKTTLTCGLCSFYDGCWCWFILLHCWHWTWRNWLSKKPGWFCGDQRESGWISSDGVQMLKSEKFRKELLTAAREQHTDVQKPKIQIWNHFFLSSSKQSLVELLQSNSCLYALFRSSAASAPDSSALFKISGCSVPADCPPLECDTCILNRLCSDNESRYLHDKNQTFEKVSYQKSEHGAIWQISISNVTIRRTSQLLLCI